MTNAAKHFLRLLPLMLLVSIGNDLPITAILNPSDINAGGATGVATVLTQWTHVSFAIVYGIINVPILLFGIRCLNLRYSLYSIFVTAVTTLLFPYLHPFMLQGHPMIAACIGAVIYGLSIGVTYRYDFSLGGFALLAKVLEVVTHRQVGTLFTVINFVPVLLAYMVHPSLSSTVWSLAFIVMTGIVINWTCMGKSYVAHCKNRFKSTVEFPRKVIHQSKHMDKAS